MYPEALVVQLFVNKKAHTFVAKWPPEKQLEIAPSADVAKEVVRALGEITSYITKGIFEGFPEPTEVVAPDGKPAMKIVGPDGKEMGDGKDKDS